MSNYYLVDKTAKNKENFSQKDVRMKTKLTKRDIAGILNIDTKTLYNWQKNKPELYRIVMLGFKFDELLEQSKKNYYDLLEISKENKNFRLN